ncbi:hypothetical protein, partial [Sansalvadorimonas verongulae]|uniref:hypothetical protein n=1 Tax=Sansalvadorimonas verongulae TaxID=2172824 RepID=UPI001E5B7DE4
MDALVSLVPCVDTFVNGLSLVWIRLCLLTGCGERLVALDTDKGPVPIVGALVFDEIAGLGERLV